VLRERLQERLVILGAAPGERAGRLQCRSVKVRMRKVTRVRRVVWPRPQGPRLEVARYLMC
jgi:hypothetical protein